MTNIFLTIPWIQEMQKKPVPIMQEYRFPFTNDDKALFFLPTPNRHIQVVVFPSPAGVMLGQIIANNVMHPFTLEASGVYYMKKASEKYKDHLSAVCGWILFTINEMNKKRVALEPADFVSAKERRIAKTFGDENNQICYRLVPLPLTNYIRKEEENCQPTGIKQRYHMRRGHTRHLPSGKIVWIKACWAGNKELGIVHKDYTTQQVSP